MSVAGSSLAVPSSPRQFLLFLTLVGGLVIGALGGVLWFQQNRRESVVRRLAEETLTSIADSKARQLENWLKERRGDGGVISSGEPVRRLLEASQDAPARRLAMQHFERVGAAYDYGVVALFDRQGVLLAATSPDRLRRHTCTEEHVRSALRATETLVIAFHRAASNEPVHFSVLSPVRLAGAGSADPDAPADGVLLLEVDPARFLDPLVRNWPVPSLTGEALLLRREGDEVVCLTQSRRHRAPETDARVPVTRTELPAVRAVLGDPGVLGGPDFHGDEVVAVARAVPGTSWRILAQVDREEIEAPLRAAAWKTGLTTGLSVIAVVLGIGLLLHRRQLRFMEVELAERRRVEAAYRESEARYRLVSENSSDVIWLLDLATDRFTYVSPSVERLSGFTVDEVLGRTPSELMAPEAYQAMRDRLAARLIAFAAGDDSVRTRIDEVVQKCRDGSVIPTEMASTLVAGPDRRVTHLQGVTRGIRERKAAEEALRRSETKFASLFRFSPDAIFLVTMPDRRIVEVNQAGGTLCGYEPGDLVGRNIDQLGFWASGEERARFVATVLARGRVEAFEAEFVVKSGGRRRCTVSSEVIELDGQPHLLSTIRDVTEGKRLPRALEEQADFTRRVFDSTDAHEAVVGPDGTILRVNEAWRRFGRENEAGEECRWGVGARYCQDPFGGDEGGVAHRACEGLRRVQRGEVERFEMEYPCHGGGEQRWFLMRAVPLQGQPGTVLVSHVDISLAKRAEARLIAAHQERERLLRFTEALLSAVPTPVFYKDREGRYLGCNLAFSELTGVSREQVMGRTAMELWPGELAEEYQRKDEELLRRPGRQIYEYRLRNRDGLERDVIYAKDVFTDESGQPAGIIGTFLDITERKRVELRLRQVSEVQAALMDPGALARKLQRITTAVVDIFAADFARIWLFGPGDRCDSGCLHAGPGSGPDVCRQRDRCLHLMASSGRYTHLDGPAHSRVPLGGYKIGRIAAGEEPSFVTNEVTVDPLVHDREWARALGLVSFAGYQLKPPEGEVFGVLALFSQRPVSSADDAMLRNLSQLVVPVIQAARAEEALRRMNQELEQRVAARTRELVASEQRFRAIWETSRDAILTTDAAGRCLDFNPAAQAMFGYPDRASMLKAGVAGLSPEYQPDGRPSAVVIAESMERIAAQGGGSFEWSHRRYDGALFPALVSVAVAEQDGQIVMHGILRDITERKQVETELRQAKEAAEAANRAKSVFLASMSHEIRTPMNAILGFSQLLLRDPRATPQQQHQLRTIARSGEHLLTLLNDILELARIESGRLTLNSAPCDLPQLIHDLEQMFLLQAHRKHLEFVVRRGEGLPGMVEADSTKLRQVLINLLGNAVKFTAAGGAVTLRVEALAGSRIRAEVEDTGPGIAADDLPRLFEPFFQTSAGRQVGGGTGLGLAISREFARLMGGELTVRTQLGRGSVFRLEMPLPVLGPGRIPSPVPGAGRVRRLAPDQPPCRVLVVDDEADNREVLEHLLAPLGFEIRSAVDGGGALAAAAEWNPHLILLDLRMPGIDGFEVTARLRAAGDGGPRILVLSATAFREDRERALAIGADRFLCKPFLEADLLECIRDLTGVEYVYGEIPAAPGSPAPPAPPPVSAGELRCLPAPLVQALRQALESADYSRLLALADEVTACDPKLGGRVREAVRGFDYAALQGLLSGG